MDNTKLKQTINEAIELAYNLAGETATDSAVLSKATEENIAGKSANIISIPHRTSSGVEGMSMPPQEKERC